MPLRAPVPDSHRLHEENIKMNIVSSLPDLTIGSGTRWGVYTLSPFLPPGGLGTGNCLTFWVRHWTWHLLVNDGHPRLDHGHMTALPVSSPKTSWEALSSQIWRCCAAEPNKIDNRSSEGIIQSNYLGIGRLQSFSLFSYHVDCRNGQRILSKTSSLVMALKEGHHFINFQRTAINTFYFYKEKYSLPGKCQH